MEKKVHWVQNAQDLNGLLIQFMIIHIESAQEIILNKGVMHV